MDSTFQRGNITAVIIHLGIFAHERYKSLRSHACPCNFAIILSMSYEWSLCSHKSLWDPNNLPLVPKLHLVPKLGLYPKLHLVPKLGLYPIPRSCPIRVPGLYLICTEFLTTWNIMFHRSPTDKSAKIPCPVPYRDARDTHRIACSTSRIYFFFLQCYMLFIISSACKPSHMSTGWAHVAYYNLEWDSSHNGRCMISDAKIQTDGRMNTWY